MIIFQSIYFLLGNFHGTEMPNLNFIFFYLTPKYLIRYERPRPVETSYYRTSPANVGPRAGAPRPGTAVYASITKKIMKWAKKILGGQKN